MATLKDLFLDELADMYDAETRISKALPKMIKAATQPDLKEGLTKHHQETLGHIEKLEEVFAAFDKKPKGKECKATVGILKEGAEILEENASEPTLNAGIISACQKVEHYEIASYGSLIEWAKLLACDEAVELLEEIRTEEEAANDALIDAAGTANETALGEETDGENADDDKPKKKKSK